ncbi:MSMEG_0570 family nitrogen starvation response protein [Mycolicibacterium sp. 050158]|uniref:MSMEG_0570 family nitrogen starvation response protein n=1 Tax=Mycolicibacterium sp. 050158 TaxID=3090602 RepID=UPI00299E55C5|nr:MSMEG_0570 family nitrogen starvation response protein [Mycolicibacterium sp. 050158]MDX1888508.1 MSMEG_0570 family nitrogen starvation response protein [Mycolicibacterium sp. 050158]
MPEMTFDVQWPDGSVLHCYSPSLVMHDYLSIGSEYAKADFLERAGAALQEASERVRAKFGFACSSAAWTKAEIDSAAAQFQPDAVIRILDMRPAPEVTS